MTSQRTGKQGEPEVLEELIQDALAETPAETGSDVRGTGELLRQSQSGKTGRFWFYFGLLQFALFFYSLSGICSKFAARRLAETGGQVFDLVFLGCFALLFVILFGYALLWQPILKVMPLTLAYSSKAVTIIWGMVWGLWIFAERLSWNHILGALIIIAGIYFVNARD